MNDLYHIVSQFKNWEKYFHLSSLSTSWRREWNGSSYEYVITGKIKFYFDGKFTKKKFTIRTVMRETYSYSGYSDSYVNDRTIELEQKLLKIKEQILASQDYLAARCGQEPNLIFPLISKAEECMLDMQNPLPTAGFIADFLETFKSFKKPR